MVGKSFKERLRIPPSPPPPPPPCLSHGMVGYWPHQHIVILAVLTFHMYGCTFAWKSNIFIGRCSIEQQKTISKDIRAILWVKFKKIHCFAAIYKVYEICIQLETSNLMFLITFGIYLVLLIYIYIYMHYECFAVFSVRKV